MIDRRHIVLGVALAASVATEYPAPPSLFYGEQTLDGEPVSLDDTRLVATWVVTVDVTLPAEAADDDFLGRMEVGAGDSASGFGEDSADLLVLVSECGSRGVVGGPNKAPLVEIEDAFASCVPQHTCKRTFCVAIGNASDDAVDVEWGVRASVQSDAWVDKKDVDSIPVPIYIAIEEAEP